MPLHLTRASETDAPRIAAIHMAAFGTNAMLLAQFPTPSIRKDLQTCILAKTLADIRDPKIAVLVVRDDDDHDDDDASSGGRKGNGNGNGEVISFAKWSLPVGKGEGYAEAPWMWPEGTDLDVLGRWSELVERVKERVVGEGVCHRLTFIGTDPLHERRGAASLLLQWGLRHCKQDNVPAYLESTVDAGPLYERHGFARAETISMALQGRDDGSESVLYEEVCFIFRPGATTAPAIEHDLKPMH